MDLGFTRLDPHCAEPVSVPIDYLTLLASLAAHQAGSRTAAVETTLSAGTFDDGDIVGALARLYAGEPGWAFATLTLAGCFNAAIAALRPGSPA